jgi:four helix bundle protein
LPSQNYRDLFAWQKAMDLVECVYRATRDWPKEEMYGLTNQVRRAVVSVPANMAEGQGRNSTREFVRYLSIAMGSLYEVETHISIAQRLQYMDAHTCDELLTQTAEVARITHGLSRRLREPHD